MKRRSFVQAAAATGGALLVERTFRIEPALAAQCPQPPGLQLYTIRELLQRDARTALVALSTRGFKELELFGLDDGDGSRFFGLTPRELKTVVTGNGLSLPSAHIGGGLTNIAATSERAHLLGVTTVIVGLASEFTEGGAMVPARNLEQLDRLGERLNRAGEEFMSRGLAFGYHNHHVEFTPVGDRVAFDYLMERTDPSLVKIELDVGWVALAGVDAVDYLTRYGRRVFACHLKDFVPRRGLFTRDAPPAQNQLVEPGAGTVDFVAVLRTMTDNGVAHGFVEIDVSEDPLAAADRGNRYLQGLNAC
jgi:sugar phosphate isomerase/epimerase